LKPNGIDLTDQNIGFSIKLMQFLVVPTFVLDANGVVIIWNAAMERLTGMPATQLIGTREHWQAFYDEKRPCLADLILSGQESKLTELYADTDNPTGVPMAYGVHAENWCHMPLREMNFYLSIDAGPIYDEQGELLAVVETIRDITQQKRNQTELEKLANLDGLTGLINRRAFDRSLLMMCQKARSEGHALSLLMIDVDHFKGYNDSYGHQAGDDCLRRVAKQLADTLRPGDLAARYGGEEFAVILPHASLDAAMSVAKRLCDGVRAMGLEHLGNEGVGRVSVSIGVSSLDPGRMLPSETLIARADQALYQAKTSGRSKVCSSADLD
jgi:diguanylate cyclase (GGDEF)-like protein